MLDKLLEYDRELLIFLNNLGIEDYDYFWQTITQPIVWIPLYIFILILVFKTYQKEPLRKSILLTLAVVLTTSLITSLVKAIIARTRPSGNSDLTELIRVIIEPNSYSFFSGHAANSFALTTFIVLILRNKYQWIYILYIWPVFFSFSRIYVGVHYPSDILAGALVGTLIALFFYQIHKKMDP
ncbi:phosphatase PAP2 family protein [Galbibacter pacificus]|uniref:Phosphatase PAP2 family protein n=1 Tax=Galbibacter pacificus TaxID=2996052 RepID=A0ABT6FLZ8_9FLAO|nr:phosphatase PAP2 family protein [Galbibacter pacificus]MDG3580792.1 phosphatase PAP2 family protein [Galbibacter pacificus]MDG3584270.1 phosphatase PAP2 family protein [Galbibacter pacificus]